MSRVEVENPKKDKEWGVLLMAHGAPECLEDIPEFLMNVRSGRKMPDAAVQEISRRYSLIGGGSPLLRLTNLQAAGLAERLNLKTGPESRAAIPVYVGMRNWRPFIADAVRQANQDGVRQLVAICLAPQNSRTSVGLYRKALMEAVAGIAPHMSVDFVESWHEHPGLIAAFGETISSALSSAENEAGCPVPVIFTAHSVPVRTVAEGDPYDRQVNETAARVAALLQLTEWRLAYQSQGMTPEPWIGPTVESQIEELAEAGHRHVLIAPIGFVCDHVEILYDIDIVFRQNGEARGMKVHRPESLNDSPKFIQALASLVSARIEHPLSVSSAAEIR